MSALIQADRPTCEESAGAEPELFEQTVRRGLVHRAAVSEVLLTGFRRSAGEAYRFGVQWPRGHSYYGAVAGRWHDPMLLAESVRQVGLYLAHEELGVPFGSHFVTSSTSFEMEPAGCRLAFGPAHITLEARVKDVVSRRGQLVAYAYEVAAFRDGERVGTGALSAQVLPGRIYQRLRGQRLSARPSSVIPAHLHPRLVGRSAGFDVVLAEGPDAATRLLRIDGSHPVLFDHPVDHVPGMVLLEAARQSALAELGCPGGLLAGMSASFTKYVELDTPCLVTASAPVADSGGRHRLDVVFTQDGSTAGTCQVVIRRDPAS